MLNRKSNKLLLIELNEFNRELLCKAADAFQFKNIQRLNSLAESQTYTSDTLDSGYLEPWVQWVSLHSGIPSSEHRIKHLGDIASLKGKQIWEVWSDRGISSGVWGVLNGKRADAKLCEFFAPDPWTFSEPGYPESVTNYVALPRYLAKNRLNISWFMVMRHLFSFIKFFTTLKAIFGLLRELPQFLTNLLRFKGAVFVGYSLAEYLATIRFLELKQKHRTDYNIIFLNLLAHSQHYYWKSKDLNQLPELKCTLYYVDKILGLLLDSLGPNERVIITNALSQTNTKNDPVWILYRQNDHKTLLDAIDIPPRKIEECMTNDAHLFFETVEATIRAKNTLTNVTINGEPLFQVESYPENPLKLFYIVRFSNEVIGKPQFTEGNKSYDFLEFFTAIVRRTGKHNGLGTVFSNIDNLALRGNLARATDQNPAPNQKVTNHELGQILANL